MAIQIEVFGPGCRKCHESADTARRFADARGIAAEVVKRSTIAEMTARGVLYTPTVFVDGEKVVEGRPLRESDLEKWLAAHPGAGR
jgi:protein-disulfide isomerase